MTMNNNIKKYLDLTAVDQFMPCKHAALQGYS